MLILIGDYAFSRTAGSTRFKLAEKVGFFLPIHLTHSFPFYQLIKLINL